VTARNVNSIDAPESGQSIASMSSFLGFRPADLDFESGPQMPARMVEL
jgi:hypothetical protein